MEIDRLHVTCPLCELQFDVLNFQMHMVFTHPEFLAIWASSTLGASFQEEDYFEFLQAFQDQDDVNTDDMTYEELLQLCERIGNHKEGISCIDEVSEKIDNPENEACPICLDELKHVSSCRKIKVCGHIYCDECIERWFEENKWCPVCKKDVQIASISKSSSSSPGSPSATTSDS